MDDSIERLANHLAHSNPESIRELKRLFWKGCEHWDEMLVERAAISGRLVLSDHTKNAIEKFRNKQKAG
jgi:methylglutaconyl-CoA hydratase